MHTYIHTYIHAYSDARADARVGHCQVGWVGCQCGPRLEYKIFTQFGATFFRKLRDEGGVGCRIPTFFTMKPWVGWRSPAAFYRFFTIELGSDADLRSRKGGVGCRIPCFFTMNPWVGCRFVFTQRWIRMPDSSVFYDEPMGRMAFAGCSLIRVRISAPG